MIRKGIRLLVAAIDIDACTILADIHIKLLVSHFYEKKKNKETIQNLFKMKENDIRFVEINMQTNIHKRHFVKYTI